MFRPSLIRHLYSNIVLEKNQNIINLLWDDHLMTEAREHIPFRWRKTESIQAPERRNPHETFFLQNSSYYSLFFFNNDTHSRSYNSFVFYFCSCLILKWFRIFNPSRDSHSGWTITDHEWACPNRLKGDPTIWFTLPGRNYWSLGGSR